MNTSRNSTAIYRDTGGELAPREVWRLMCLFYRLPGCRTSCDDLGLSPLRLPDSWETEQPAGRVWMKLKCDTRLIRCNELVVNHALMEGVREFPSHSELGSAMLLPSKGRHSALVVKGEENFTVEMRIEDVIYLGFV